MINNVQVLRAIAALLVLLAHSAGFNEARLGPVLSAGTRGVDLFFVISGFVMVVTTSARHVSPGQFLANRAIRIIPLYWLLTIGVFAIAALAPGLVKATRADGGELLKSLFFIPFEKQNGLIQPVLFVGWSLNYEMFFYALFGICLFIGGPVRRVALISAVLVALVMYGAVYHPASAPLRFYTEDLVLEFVFGMIAGLLYPRIVARPWPVAAGAVLLVAGFVGLLGPLLIPPGYPHAISGIGGAGVLMGALVLEARGFRVRNRFLLTLGAASYALYLVHAFPLIAIQRFAPRFGYDHGIAMVVAIMLSAAAIIAGSIGVHLLIERPIGNWLRRSLTPAARGARPDRAALWPWRRRSP